MLAGEIEAIKCHTNWPEKEINQTNSAPNGVSEDPSIQRNLRGSAAEGTKNQNAEVLAMNVQQVQKCLTSMFTKGSHSSSTVESGDQIDGN